MTANSDAGDAIDAVIAVGAVESLCGSCAHLTSDHETTAEWTPELKAQYGTPCNRCNANPYTRAGLAFSACVGYAEWPIQHIPEPGSDIAIQIGCRCLKYVNVLRAKRCWPFVYAPDCPIHVWVCQRKTTCEHIIEPAVLWAIYDIGDGQTTKDHSGRHFSCEHCTIPVIECEMCGQRWLDWRTRPEQSGWLKISEETPNLKPVWRCSVCRQ
jgi:hypothetical protein